MPEGEDGFGEGEFLVGEFGVDNGPAGADFGGAAGGPTVDGFFAGVPEGGGEFLVPAGGPAGVDLVSDGSGAAEGVSAGEFRVGTGVDPAGTVLGGTVDGAVDGLVVGEFLGGVTDGPGGAVRGGVAAGATGGLLTAGAAPLPGAGAGVTGGAVWPVALP